MISHVSSYLTTKFNLFLDFGPKVKSKEIPDCYIRDVLRASTAAPTYLAPYYFTSVAGDGVKREFNMVDGGICANNPVGFSYTYRLVALHMAMCYPISHLLTVHSMPNMQTFIAVSEYLRDDSERGEGEAAVRILHNPFNWFVESGLKGWCVVSH